MKKVLGLTLLLVSVSTQAALLGRLPATPGGADCQAYFDDDLQITWTASANINGAALWPDQVAWASSLTIGGLSQWRLASIAELDHLYVSEGVTALSPEPFTDVVGQPNYYWSGTTSSESSSQAHYMSFETGNLGATATKTTNFLYAWAVHPGDPFGSCPESPLDTDGDGVADASDNCILVANADQRDTNGDGIGNICDPDLNNDCMINFGDLNIMKAVFFGNDPDSDLDGDGGVNFADLNVVKTAFFGAPGPSGLPNACD